MRCSIVILIILIFSLQFQNCLAVTPVNFDNGVMAFDVGPSTSIVWPGFTKLSANDNYGVTGSYGWTDLQATIFICRPYSNADPLGVDYASGYGPFGFKANVSNGEYTVIFFSGDLMYGGQNTTILLGSNQYEDLNSDSGPNFSPKVFTTVVANGVLSIRFTTGTSASGFGKINAIIIAPSNLAASTIAKCQIVANEMNTTDFQVTGENSPVWIERLFIETIAEPVRSSEELQNGFIGYTRNYLERIFPNSNPRVSESNSIKTGISLSAARGEYEPLIFAFLPTESIMDISFSVSDLIGPNNSRISLDTKLVKQWKQKIVGSWDVHYSVLPELLELVPDELISIPNDTSRQFWLTALIQDNAMSGMYKGTATFSVNGKASKSYDINLTVRPFKLDKKGSFSFGVWYNANFREDQIESDLPNISRHGLDGIEMNAPVSFVYNSQSGWNYDYTTIERIINAYKQAGLSGPIPFQLGAMFERLSAEPFYYPVGTWDNKNTAIQLISNLQNKIHNENWPEFIYYVADELHNSSSQRNRAIDLGWCVHQVSGARTFATGTPDSFFGLNSYIDVRAFPGQFVTQQSVEQAILEGDEVWLYYNPPFVFENPAHARFIFGVYAWRLSEIGLKGVWGFDYQSANGNPHQDMDVRIKDWCATYPSPNGPVNTIQFEGVREGIDDFKYLITLQNRIQSLSNDANFASTIESANAFLNSVRQQISIDFIYDYNDQGVGAFNNSPALEWYDNTRKTAADFIEQMTPIPAICGDPGTAYIPGDLNSDCYIDFQDFAIMCQYWMKCNDRFDTQCN